MGKKNKGQKLPIVPIKDGKKGGASGSGDAARPTTTKDTETSGSSDRSVKQHGAPSYLVRGSYALNGTTYFPEMYPGILHGNQAGKLLVAY